MITETEKQRLKLYRFLWEKLNLTLILLKENSKIPIFKGWNNHNNIKMPFHEAEFIIQNGNGQKLKNAGILTGDINGIVIIDVDDFDLFQKFREENHFELPETFTVRSGGKSNHYYYKIPSGEKNLGRRQLKKYGFDLLAESSYAVAPGSIHPETGKIYEIYKDHGYTFTEAPDWVIRLAKHMDKSKQNTEEIPVGPQTANPEIQTRINAIDINQLNFTDKTKELIKDGVPKGQRSEAVISVIASLIYAKAADNEIRAIFESYPIGEKYREKGSHKHQYLEDEIWSARKFLQNNNYQFNMRSYKKFRRQNQPMRRCVTLEDIMNTQSRLEFIIDGVWPKQSPLLIVGPSGVGKSNFVFNLAAKLACAGTQKFLGMDIVQGNYKTLFVQSENSLMGVKQRFSYIIKGVKLNSAAIQNIIFPDVNEDVRCTGDLESEDFLLKIERLIGKYQPQILIFDPLVSFHQADENANVQMRKVLDNLTYLGDEKNVNIVLIHHTGKGQTNGNGHGGRGASAIGDWAPNILELKPEKDNNGNKLIKLKHTKARDVKEIDDIELILDRKTLTFMVHNNNQQNQGIVVQALKNIGGVANTQNDLINEIQKTIDGSKNTIVKIIREAVQAGMIKETKKGKKISYHF